MKISNALLGISLMAALAIGILPARADEIAHATVPAAPAPAAKWDVNQTINQTNFIVGGQCSGTLISLKYRLVLTNHHCTDGFTSVEEHEETDASGKVESVKREVFKDMPLVQKTYQGFRNVGEASFQSVIVADKKTYDLALLQIRADKIPQTIYSHVLRAGKDVTRGDNVFVVGNPLLLDASLSRGVVSSTTRMLKAPWADDADVPFFQVDAAVNPGNSGGALYNEAGELIGVPAAGFNGYTGLGLAIPYTLVQKFLTELCYEDVWNDEAVKDHDACEKDKLDEKNAARAKAGLPALKEDPKPESFSGSVAPRAASLLLRDTLMDRLFEAVR